MGRSERKRGIMPDNSNALRLPKREPGEYNRRGRRIGGPITAAPVVETLGTNNTSVTPVTAEGASSPSYYEAVRQGPEGGRLPSAGNAGSGNGRDIPRGDASGTQTGPSQAKPADMAAFMARLQSPDFNIKFNYNEQDRNGYQSNALPGTAATKQFATDEFSADDAQVMGMSAQDSMTLANGGSIETVIGGSTAKGAQSGASDAADVGDQSRALRVPGSQRAQQIFNERYHYLNNPVPPEIDKGEGFSARSRAFLDYEGKGGAAGALRAAEAAQGTIKQNGVLYGMDADGNATRISDEGADILRRDRNAVASQEFLNNYQYVPAGPNETQSADVIRPVSTSVSSDAYFSGDFGSTTNVGDVFDMSQSAKLQSDPANQPYNITEDIQMRTGKDVPMMRF